MEVARTIAKRATCDRGRSGCVIAKDNQILVTGYVGSPAGLAHCDEAGHLMRKMIHADGSVTQHCVRTVHAEQNAIIQAATLGQSIEDGAIYITHQPCAICAKMIINAGIKRIVVREGYPDNLAVDILDEAGLKVITMGKETTEK